MEHQVFEWPLHSFKILVSIQHCVIIMNVFTASCIATPGRVLYVPKGSNYGSYMRVVAPETRIYIGRVYFRGGGQGVLLPPPLGFSLPPPP